MSHNGAGGPSQVILAPQQHEQGLRSGVEPPPLQVSSLITSGPSSNRVDLVFFSDGYTEEEYNKFIEDATRLAQDVSANQTFYTVKPLLNFWAAFSPSKEVARFFVVSVTPFGLYRDGTELRGLYSSKPDTALAACESLQDKCDYAILLGNDPLYGGLGGEFTTITSSLANGALVLRHELGHSIIDVGEEYDGGFAYFGVNAADTLSSVTWSHWLSDPDTPPREERSVSPLQAYPWTLLNTTTPFSTNFTSSGQYSQYLVKFSLSGVPEEKDLDVLLDGANLGWTPPRQDIGIDRWHYNLAGYSALSEGDHELQFILKNENTQGQAQLCSVEILEFGDDSEFNSGIGYYGAFPTFDLNNETTYRPTYEGCLMRSVTYPNFCKVCLEGLWLSLLKRVDLIDNVRESCIMKSASEVDSSTDQLWKKVLELDLVPLAQLRHNTIGFTESYKITWSTGGTTLEQFTNQTRIEVDDDMLSYDIDIVFSTNEVRKDDQGWLTASRSYSITETCG
ncbi:hypothetical protein SERLA73DRAFT_128061 [Serpula lacrymans var. lacrymans S7.3]|uniref:IgA peptidase M64-domain-containing protein n=1 Tax=Serpula lacrymans var. lacrymans (strain S7.3) TaxID=936435 RepID=F8QJ13_SERL3|nr:hypothetical protein SERLA73DRAFT_128061 [Serpula lacrymans var. lacrymans S7.3]